jgi:hypothetical protein
MGIMKEKATIGGICSTAFKKVPVIPSIAIILQTTPIKNSGIKRKKHIINKLKNPYD